MAPDQTAAQPSPATKARLDNIDCLRGIIMIVMALDHSRDFFSNAHAYFDPSDVTRTTAAFFLTRWITDFCAPVFSFLAGLGVWLSASHGKSKQTVARMLVTRGLWLIFLELIIIRAFWYFNFDYTVLKAAVIWCLGWSMIALAGLIFLPPRAILIISLAMIAGHNLLDGLKPSDFGALSGLWTILHVNGPVMLPGGVKLIVLYPLIPWIGVMGAGYCFGEVLALERTERRRLVFRIGLALTVAFVIVRGLNVYGDPRPWMSRDSLLLTVFDALACEKYPPSLSYLLMTMGPALMLLAALDRPELPGVLRPALVYGRVPFLYYVLHLPLLHAMAAIWATLRYGSAPWMFANPGSQHWPADFAWDLPLTYLAWAAAVVALYPVCRWFAGVKAARRDWWLSYL